MKTQNVNPMPALVLACLLLLAALTWAVGQRDPAPDLGGGGDTSTPGATQVLADCVGGAVACEVTVVVGGVRHHLVGHGAGAALVAAGAEDVVPCLAEAPVATTVGDRQGSGPRLASQLEL